jgi:hypothetical protein
MDQRHWIDSESEQHRGERRQRSTANQLDVTSIGGLQKLSKVAIAERFGNYVERRGLSSRLPGSGISHFAMNMKTWIAADGSARTCVVGLRGGYGIECALNGAMELHITKRLSDHNRAWSQCLDRRGFTADEHVRHPSGAEYFLDR